MSINFDRVTGNIEELGNAPRGASPEVPEGMSGAELAFLRLVASNSKYSIRPKSTPMLKGRWPANALSPLSIATISTSLSQGGLRPGTGLSVTPHFKPISRSSDRYRLFALDDRLAVDDMKGFLSSAVLETGAKLRAFEQRELGGCAVDGCNRMIVVNEFGFPFPMEPEDRLAFLNELECEMTRDPTMRDFWSSCYLVFGSFHCHNEMKNSAVISLPYTPMNIRELANGPITDIAELAAMAAIGQRDVAFGKPQQGERYNFTQDKFCPAEKIGERLVPRNKIDWAYYDTDMGRVGVLICFDALDPRMLLRLVLLHLNDTNKDLGQFSALVVPCFSPNDTVLECCQLISQVLGTLVIYVNVQYVRIKESEMELPTPDRPRPTGHAYFYAGEQILGGSTMEGIVSGELEESSRFDMSKNLWYSTRFCHIDRKALNEATVRAPEPFSQVFTEIFAPSAKMAGA